MKQKEFQQTHSKKEVMKKIAIGAGKVVLACIAMAGVGVVACIAPNIFSAFGKLFSYRSGQTYTQKEKRAIRNMFAYLRRRGYLKIDQRGRQIYIRLTKEGKKFAGKYQINDLRILPQRSWDRKWRILLFDIPHFIRIQREALRGKLKELGFQLLQKSVWVHAYPCEKEVELLRNFFGLRYDQIHLLVTDSLGAREQEMRRSFHLVG